VCLVDELKYASARHIVVIFCFLQLLKADRDVGDLFSERLVKSVIVALSNSPFKLIEVEIIQHFGELFLLACQLIKCFGVKCYFVVVERIERFINLL
jgi:hypothetical protein